MISWTTEARGNYIKEHAIDGDYRFEVIGPYQKQPMQWSACYQNKSIGSGNAESVDKAKFFAVVCKVDHMHGLAPYPD